MLTQVRAVRAADPLKGEGVFSRSIRILSLAAAVCGPLTFTGAAIAKPITLLPFPSEIIAKAADGANVVAVYENNQGQMLDDVRLAVLGRCPVEFIGGLSVDSSGFGIAPDFDVAVMRERIEKVSQR